MFLAVIYIKNPKKIHNLTSLKDIFILSRLASLAAFGHGRINLDFRLAAMDNVPFCQKK